MDLEVGVKMVGRVEEYIIKRIEDEKAVHMALIDPEKVTPELAALLSREIEASGSSAIMIGGTTLASVELLNDITRAVKSSVKIPVILFPNNVTGISGYADAIWFMSLLNSADPYFIFGAQTLAAPIIKRLGLEAIPLGYIIVGEGGAAGVIGKACPIPYNKPELAAAHALAAQFLGMRFIYLEAGSGASRPVPPEMIKMTRETVDVKIIVGGGIKTGAHAERAIKAGADIVVTGTALENSGIEKVRAKVAEIIEGMRRGAKNKFKGV
ncbi:MAG: geranylgeranylglyceryl/heptaprenylglyceryl phosphate synthase [Candidatus Bathyarchaeota archaeon]|nr:geranylgeranylglyceryl/heptaprenylglyceryl phosphate synthase [Candidatus Bathyarchaeota archaeon]